MSEYRKRHKERSNNSSNPNQNICVLNVCKAFGVHNEIRYLHTHNDVCTALRKRYAVRSRMSSVKGKTVGGVRRELVKIAEKEKAMGNRVYGFIFSCMSSGGGHCVALNADGTTMVDTDPRKRDARRFWNLKVVMNKGCNS